MVSMSAVSVVAMPGQSVMKLPQTVILVLLGSSFSGRMVQTICGKVTVLPLGTWCLWMKKIVLVPLTLFPTPWARLPSSFAQDLSQSLRQWGSLIKSLHSICFPVMWWATAKPQCWVSLHASVLCAGNAMAFECPLVNSAG